MGASLLYENKVGRIEVIMTCLARIINMNCVIHPDVVTLQKIHHHKSIIAATLFYQQMHGLMSDL